MTEPPAEDFQARSTRLRVVERKWFQTFATRRPNSSIIITIVPRFASSPAPRFLRSAFVLRLYYMRYYKSVNTAKLTSFAPRPTRSRIRLNQRIKRMPISEQLLEILVCPACRAKVEIKADGSGLKCVECKRVYPIRDDIPVMLIDEARIEDEQPAGNN